MQSITKEPDEYGSLLARHHPLLGDADDTHPPMPSATQDDAPNISYWEFLSQNRNYRWYITSYLITHFGEWLTYIASIDFIETVQETEHGSKSRLAISILILVRLVPNIVLSAPGGTLADTMDRRHVLIGLDICGAFCAGLFVVALEYESIHLLYVASACQQCIAGLYAPSHSAIVPQLVASDAQLKKATTLEGVTWSAMQAFGAASSGWMVDVIGIKLCFVVDGMSYAISALFLLFVKGSFKVSEKTEEVPNATRDNAWQNFCSMVVDGVQYLKGSYFGTPVLLKGTAALGFGACDILNVAFSEQTDEGDDPLASSNRKLGILFSLVGVGCLLGPLVSEPWLHVERPGTLQVSCIIGFGLSSIGYFGWASMHQFWSICTFAVIRSAGSSNIWIHSTLLLQKFSAPHMLGRVLAADYAIALFGEALAAYLCGYFMDHHKTWTPYDVSWVLAFTTSSFTAGWLIYHISGRGAGQYARFREERETTDSSTLGNERSSLL